MLFAVGKHTEINLGRQKNIFHGISLIKTVAFIAGKKKSSNPKINRFSIEIKLKNDFKGEIASKIQFRPT